MSIRILMTFAVLLVAITLFSLPAAQALPKINEEPASLTVGTTDGTPIPGQQAPEITVEGMNGDLLKLSALRGNYVIIYFWRPFEPTTMLVSIFDLYRKHSSSGNLRLFTIALQSDKNKDWIQTLATNNAPGSHHGFEIVPSSKNSAYALLGRPGLNANTLVDPNGNYYKVNATFAEIDNALLNAFSGQNIGQPMATTQPATTPAALSTIPGTQTVSPIENTPVSFNPTEATSSQFIEITSKPTASPSAAPTAAPASANKTTYKIQLAAVKTVKTSNYTSLSKIGAVTTMPTPNNQAHRVFLGEFTEQQNARIALDEVKKSGFKDAFLVYFENGAYKGAVPAPANSAAVTVTPVTKPEATPNVAPEVAPNTNNKADIKPTTMNVNTNNNNNGNDRIEVDKINIPSSVGLLPPPQSPPPTFNPDIMSFPPDEAFSNPSQPVTTKPSTYVTLPSSPTGSSQIGVQPGVTTQPTSANIVIPPSLRDTAPTIFNDNTDEDQESDPIGVNYTPPKRDGFVNTTTSVNTNSAPVTTTSPISTAPTTTTTTPATTTTTTTTSSAQQSGIPSYPAPNTNTTTATQPVATTTNTTANTNNTTASTATNTATKGNTLGTKLQEVAATAPTTAPPAVTPAASDTKPNNINTIGYGEISDKQMEEYMRSNSNILENTKSDRLKAKDKRKKKKRSKK